MSRLPRFAFSRVLSCLLSLLLINTQVSTNFTPPLSFNLFATVSSEIVSVLSHSAFLLNRLAIILQGGTNLDYLRANTPAAPDLPGGTNVTPPTSYVEKTASGFVAELARPENDTGVAGGKPLQVTDPTAGSAVAGGFSYHFLSRNYNFTAPILSLPGRAGFNLDLGLSWNSKVWTKSVNTLGFNAEKGFPAPGWRLGFGLIQGAVSGAQVVPYTSLINGKQSYLYIGPDGTRRELALNTTTGLYESYDGSSLDSFGSMTEPSWSVLSVR